MIPFSLKRPFRTLLLPAMLLSMTAATVHAQAPNGQVYATSVVRDDGPYTDTQSGAQGGAVSNSAHSGYGSANASAVAMAGSIGAGAVAQSVYDPTNQEFATTSSAMATAEFRDSLLVFSSLAPNVPIRIKVTNAVSGLLKASSPGAISSFAEVAGEVIASTANSGVGLSITGNTIEGITRHDEAGYFTVFTGDTITLDDNLEVDAETEGNNSDQTPFAAANYAMPVYLDPTIDGVTLISASGHDYVSAVPSPTGWTTMLFGLGATSFSLCFRKRRASRSRRPH